MRIPLLSNLFPYVFSSVFFICLHSSAYADNPTTDTAPQNAKPPLLTSLTGQITLLNGAAPDIAVVLTILNSDETPFQGEVGFVDTPMTPMVVPAGESLEIPLPVNTLHAGKKDRLQKTKIDFALLLDGKAAPTIERTDIQILLPKAAYPLIRSEPPVMNNGPDEPAPYDYFAQGQQVQPLTLSYNPGPINLSIRKTVYPIPIVTGPVEIDLEITNHGSVDAQNITLRDTLPIKFFDADAAGFTRYPDDGTLIWENTVESLAPGEVRHIRYQANATIDAGGESLPAAIAIMDEELSGMSNKVWLPGWH
ncbi:MAG: hypothetical protein P1U57_02745 [Oleibacter sp.]|nr:hypothetical protein [Thalassolituus sp.]